MRGRASSSPHRQVSEAHRRSDPAKGIQYGTVAGLALIVSSTKQIGSSAPELRCELKPRHLHRARGPFVFKSSDRVQTIPNVAVAVVVPHVNIAGSSAEPRLLSSARSRSRNWASGAKTGSAAFGPPARRAEPLWPPLRAASRGLICGLSASQGQEHQGHLFRQCRRG